MRIIGDITENQMVAAFLQAELASPRFQNGVFQGPEGIGTDRSIIDEPNFTDPSENSNRIEILANRGYRNRTLLFTGFPSTIQWRAAALDTSDCRKLKVINDRPWIEWAGGTHRAVDAAAKLESEPSLDDITAHIAHIISTLKAGKSLPPLLLVSLSIENPFVILEGHTRAMAGILCGINVELSAYIGTST